MTLITYSIFCDICWKIITKTITVLYDHIDEELQESQIYDKIIVTLVVTLTLECSITYFYLTSNLF